MRSYLPLALVLLVPSLPAAAQQLTESRFEKAEIQAVPVSAVTPVEAPRLQSKSEADIGGGVFSTRSLVHAVGGAIVGGWIGLFGAQVVHSDWDETRDGDFGTRRTQWAAAGVVVGLLGSRLVTRTTAPRPGPGPLAVRSERNRNVLTAEEIRADRANNAYELIVSLRKEWLVPRGTNSWAETSGGVAEGVGRTFTVQIEEGRDKIIVYMDDIRIGGPEDMKDIPADGLTKAEFIDARRATYLYGAGHAHGVIRLSTDVETPGG